MLPMCVGVGSDLLSQGHRLMQAPWARPHSHCGSRRYELWSLAVAIQCLLDEIFSRAEHHMAKTHVSGHVRVIL